MRTLPVNEPHRSTENAPQLPKTEDDVDTDIGIELENTV